jgi:TRAP-type mannitol/chloroaromatic compound transport system permease small subunit
MKKKEISFYLDRISKYAGYVAAFLVVVLSLLVAYDAGMRYLFSAGYDWLLLYYFNNHESVNAFSNIC